MLSVCLQVGEDTVVAAALDTTHVDGLWQCRRYSSVRCEYLRCCFNIVRDCSCFVDDV